jgi:hypothetical protein
MNIYKFYRVFIYVVPIICFWGCLDGRINAPKNNPFIQNEENRFVFAIQANNYTEKIFENIVFTTPNNGVQLRISNYQSGIGVIRLDNKDPGDMFLDSLNQNEEVTVNINFVPEYFIVDMTNFTGNINFVVEAHLR